MLGGKGVFRGTSVLVSGAPGTGKSTVAVSFADASCRRGKRALMFCYEESASQMLRNMRSIGIDLGPSIEKGLLRIHAARPTLQGLEQHLSDMHRLVREFKPALVVVDPIQQPRAHRQRHVAQGDADAPGGLPQGEGITGVFTSLTATARPSSPTPSSASRR
jgi:circadian clock protein KaiC